MMSECTKKNKKKQTTKQNKTKHKSEQKLMIRAYKGQVVLCYMLHKFCKKFVLFSLSFLGFFYLPPITVNCYLKHILRL